MVDFIENAKIKWMRTGCTPMTKENSIYFSPGFSYLPYFPIIFSCFLMVSHTFSCFSPWFSPWFSPSSDVSHVPSDVESNEKVTVAFSSLLVTHLGRICAYHQCHNQSTIPWMSQVWWYIPKRFPNKTAKKHIPIFMANPRYPAKYHKFLAGERRQSHWYQKTILE